MGLDWFILIKYYANFQAILKNNVIFTLISLVCLGAFFHGVCFPICLLLKKEHILSHVSFCLGPLALLFSPNQQ